MSPDAAAVFAQVIPVLFIACYMGGIRRDNWGTQFIIFISGIAEIWLLVTVATSSDMNEIGLVFVWAAVIGLLFTVMRAALHGPRAREK